jgi:N-acetylglucosamine kinase-like BadF-type ATPase
VVGHPRRGRPGPQTALRSVVAGHFGVPEVRDAAVAIHLGKISEDDLQGLAPLLLAAAGQGDQVALDLVSRLAGEIVTMAGSVIRRLGLSESAVPVAGRRGAYRPGPAASRLDHRAARRRGARR